MSGTHWQWTWDIIELADPRLGAIRVMRCHTGDGEEMVAPLGSEPPWIAVNGTWVKRTIVETRLRNRGNLQ